MPTPVKLDTAVLDPDRVSLLIGGRVHRDWNRYDIDSDLLTPADVARQLGVSEDDVMQSVTAGDLKAKKIGTAYRITRAALEEFLKA